MQAALFHSFQPVILAVTTVQQLGTHCNYFMSVKVFQAVLPFLRI